MENLSLIAAVGENGELGYNNSLIWRIREDLQFYKEMTMGKKIIMGRKTYQNLPGKLKNRNIFIVTSDINYQQEDCTIINDFTSFLNEHYNDDTEYIICGGSSIYKQSYPYCSKGYLSVVKGDYQVDSYFDNFNFDDFMIVFEKDYDQFVYRQLKRISR